MVIAVDIGNTNINLALLDGAGKVKKKYKVVTDGRGLSSLVKSVKKNNSVEKIIVVSVVPHALRRVKRILGRQFRKIKVNVVGSDVMVPMKCEYKRDQIGQDRLVTAFGAVELYGLPILIVDFGTAVTFDVVSKKGVYLGGVIVPGIKMSLESLSERTAMLPKAFLKETDTLIGKNTTESIRSGMIFGYSSLCEGIVRLFRKKVDKKIKIIATGGDAELISRHTPSISSIDQDLALKGLYLISKIIRKK